jgi:hypothetical protein
MFSPSALLGLAIGNDSCLDLSLCTECALSRCSVWILRPFLNVTTDTVLSRSIVSRFLFVECLVEDMAGVKLLYRCEFMVDAENPRLAERIHANIGKVHRGRIY